jgi:hypothetical protein
VKVLWSPRLHNSFHSAQEGRAIVLRGVASTHVCSIIWLILKILCEKKLVIIQNISKYYLFPFTNFGSLEKALKIYIYFNFSTNNII